MYLYMFETSFRTFFCIFRRIFVANETKPSVLESSVYVHSIHSFRKLRIAIVVFIFQACFPLNFVRRLDFVANEKKD